LFKGSDLIMSSYQLDELKQQVTDLTAAEMRQLASYLLGDRKSVV
jgi:hypothetical protein